MVNDLVIGMAGSGGDGVVSAGESVLAAAASEGYHAIMTKSFGSQIRGGESSCRVRLSTAVIWNPGGALDVAVALNWEDFMKFGGELPISEHTVLIHEEKAGPPPESLVARGGMPTEIIAVPFSDLAKESAGTEKAKTSVVLGVLSALFGVPAHAIRRGLTKKFGAKSAELLAANERALEAGMAFAETHPLKVARPLPKPLTPPGSKLLCDGNDMHAAGAIFAGVQFFAGYPITPSTEIMQILTRELWKHGGSVLQCEDEIASIGAAVGASYAGRKSMTASSGPGLSLKTEIMGLATIAELPLVIVNVQRGGPSTGLPTKPEQGDLYQAAFSAHGDVLRPVLAPTTVADSFKVTVDAFNIAEEFQTPVLILSDQEIAQRKETVNPIDTSKLEIKHRRLPTDADLEDYKRFRITPDFISPISHPGMEKGAYLCAGIEHKENGEPTGSGEMHTRMNEKRFKKLAPLLTRREYFEVIGDPNAPIGVVSWGGAAGVCREAVAQCRAEGVPVKLLVPYLVYPIAEAVYDEFFASVRAGMVVELSYQGQFYRILRMFVDVPKGVQSLCRSGANPFQPTEIVSRVRDLSRKLEL